MPNTTPASLESISTDLLLSVSGGCHKRSCCSGPNIQQQQIVMPPAPAPQILPQAPAPAPAAPEPAAAPTGDVISTSVSINGQPAS
jgi:hypothetical protein